MSHTWSIENFLENEEFQEESYYAFSKFKEDLKIIDKKKAFDFYAKLWHLGYDIHRAGHSEKRIWISLNQPLKQEHKEKFSSEFNIRRILEYY